MKNRNEALEKCCTGALEEGEGGERKLGDNHCYLPSLLQRNKRRAHESPPKLEEPKLGPRHCTRSLLSEVRNIYMIILMV